ncbi:hypothetical protein [Malikia spinosa]|uniref:hypothetical protein n=1 Tax=Malikia spinosa TaxID=86180 RepID=UPI002FDAB38D
MSVIWMDSCGDHYTYTQAGRFWDTVTSVAAVETGRRTGSSCIRIQGSGGAVEKTVNNLADVVVSWGGKYQRALVVVPLGIYDGATRQLYFECVNDGKITVKNGSGTTLGESIQCLTENTWAWIEVKVTAFSNTVGGVVIRVNGAVVLTLTNVDTLNTANAYCTKIRLGSDVNSYYAAWLDDVVVSDLSGSLNNDFLGDVSVVCMLPSAEGSNSGWTPNSGTVHYDRVSQTTSDDDTTYLSTDTTGVLDSWNFADLTASSTILAAQLNQTVRKTDAGTAEIAGVCRRASTDYVGTTQAVGGTAYTGYAQVWEVDPSTAAQWTQANLNAAEFGIKKVT